MEINVGDYVRTKCGIAKLNRIGNGYQYFLDSDIYDENTLENTCVTYEEYITNHSKDIIDLIEVGDYVNGYKVSYKDNDYKPFVQCDYPVQEGTTNHYRFYEEAIYSIVTKEQFEANAYKIEKER